MNDELINLLREIRPNYGDIGSRDMDTTRRRKQIDRAIELLSASKQAAPGEDLRQAIGEALTDKLGEMIGTEGPMDPYDSREIDVLLDAIMPLISQSLCVSSQYYCGNSWLSDRINRNEPLFREIDAAIKEEFGQ